MYEKIRKLPNFYAIFFAKILSFYTMFQKASRGHTDTVTAIRNPNPYNWPPRQLFAPYCIFFHARHFSFPVPLLYFTRNFCNFVTLPLLVERKRLKSLINKGDSECFARVTKPRYKHVTKKISLLQNRAFFTCLVVTWREQYRLRYKNFGPLFTESKFVTYSLRIQSY